MSPQDRISADDLQREFRHTKAGATWFKWYCRTNAGHMGWRPDWPDGTVCPACGSICSTYQRRPTAAQRAEWEKRQ